MGQALYRKYRSRSLDEIVGQEHVTNTMRQAIKQGRISHAYLLTGPRGVGKTSVARILAHEVNELPYDDDSSHIDIIEIDAASNRRIDEIRDLREKVNIAPASAKYKVYIIDEVHMLTKEAFNALLKTLEEPPQHVIFILATTDAHKLPETIISRTQRFNFKPVEKPKVIKHLKAIAKDENIKVSDEAIELLAEHGEGSFRDSISLLDQASNQTDVLEVKDVQQLLGIPPDQAIEQLVSDLGASPAPLMQQLEALYLQGFQASAIASQVASKIRLNLIRRNLKLKTASVLELLEDLIKVPASYEPAHFLELSLLKTADIQATERKPAPKTFSAEVELKAPRNEATVASRPALASTKADEVWTSVLSELKTKHNTLYGIVRMAEPTITKDKISLAFAFAFHQKRSNESANRQKIADIVLALTGNEVTIECILDPKAKPMQPTVAPKKPAQTDDLSTISNIFGKAELLES